MKKLLVLLVGMLLVGSVIGQTATYEEVRNKKLKNGKIQTYITESNDTISIGDTLMVGVPVENRGMFTYLCSPFNAFASNSPNLRSHESGNIAIIKTIKVWGRRIYATTFSNGESIGLTINNFENAWNSKELETF
jgi:hypothetical protein